MTYLTVPILDFEAEAFSWALQGAVAGGADMVELRLDFAAGAQPAQVQPWVEEARHAGLRVMVTCRPEWEGGHFSGDARNRLTLLQAAAAAGADLIDLEWRAVRESADFAAFFEQIRHKTVLSHHDFHQCPTDLEQRVAQMKRLEPAVCKVAYQPANITECFAALDLMSEDVLAMAMGQAGTMTRLLAPKVGAFLTFCGLNEQAVSAPGQIELQQMKQLYRWDSVGSQTSCFGVIGSPVAHSMSPAIHNASFGEVGFDGLYLPLLVDPAYDIFAAFIDGLRKRPWLGFRGMSVTIPHKENALRYLQEHNGGIDPLARRIGAVNTIVLREDGRVMGTNTDYLGALEPIRREMLRLDRTLSDSHAAVVGAGGVSRAIVAGLCDAGCKVTIYNRTADKARRLAQEFQCKHAPIEQLSSLKADIIVNGTSLGMSPHIDATPVPQDVLGNGTIVFDSVYNPPETLLLHQARQAGAATIDGVSMFVQQAAAQFHLFTGEQPPLELMRSIVEQRLSQA